jgi:protease-4
MTQDRVKELGGGRVWSGIDAKENGLIDELGGLDAAIAAARELAGAADAKVVQFPKEKNLMEILEEALTLNISAGAGSMIESQAAWQAAKVLIPEAHLRHLAFMVRSMADRPAAMAILTWSLDLNID